MNAPKYHYCVYWESPLALKEEGFRECRAKKEADKLISLLKKMGYTARLKRTIIPNI